MRHNKYKVTIDNDAGKRKSIFTPSGVIDSKDNYSTNYDYNYVSNRISGSETYSFDAYSLDVNSELLELNRESTSYSNKYLESENVYSHFVNANYLTVSDEMKEYLQGYFFNQDYNQDDKDIYTVTTRIRTILSLLNNYSDDNLREYSGNDDFIHWFLETSKTGNSVSFASTAVMAYRTMGIPARYVEGYYVSDSDVSSMNENNSTTMELKEEDSHAWVEVYSNQIGWVPIEVTPGFYSNEMPVQQVVGTPQQKPVAIDPNQEAAQDYYEYQQKSKDKPVEEKVIEAVVTTAKYISITMITIFGIWLLLEGQRLIRIRHYQRKLHSYNDEQYVRYYYNEMIHCLSFYEFDDNYVDYPYTLLNENQSELENYEALNKTITIFQQVIFGDLPIEQYQLRIVESSIDDLNRYTFKNINLLKKLKWRYLYIK